MPKNDKEPTNIFEGRYNKQNRPWQFYYFLWNNRIKLSQQNNCCDNTTGILC